MVSPGSGLGASCTGLAAGSIVRPRAPTPVDHLKIKFEEDKLCREGSGKHLTRNTYFLFVCLIVLDHFQAEKPQWQDIYHSTGCCNWRLEKNFQHRLCPRKKVMDLCKTWKEAEICICANSFSFTLFSSLTLPHSFCCSFHS